MIVDVGSTVGVAVLAAAGISVACCVGAATGVSVAEVAACAADCASESYSTGYPINPVILKLCTQYTHAIHYPSSKV